ncbi:MAG: threonine/serine exporter family protein [Clostridia bacterium]|nr:threonine/serine exporter family protein [Clostridia bacterium]
MSKFRSQHMAIKWHELIDVDSCSAAVNASLKDKASLVGRVGLMMLSSGTGAWRVRASMNKTARALGIVCNADIGLLSIEYTCVDEDESYTGALSINTTSVNNDRLDAIEFFTDTFAGKAEKYSVEQFHTILDSIAAKPGNYRPWQLSLASGFACMAFAFLLGGGLPEMLLSFFGAAAGMLVRKLLIDRHITLLANVTLAVITASTVYMLLSRLGGLAFGLPSSHEAGYICSMLFVIPGFPLITGGFDIAKLDLRSGLERLAYAFLIIITAALTGWLTAVAFGITPSDFPEQQLPAALKYPLRMLASFVGVYGFSYLFNSKRRMAVAAGIIGMIANTLRFVLLDFTSVPAGAAAFAGAFAAGLLASLIKQRIGYPRITLTVPSIVIMVPGMYLYKGIYYLGIYDIASGSMWLTKAVLIMSGLPLGLIAARILTDRNFRKSS